MTCADRSEDIVSLALGALTPDESAVVESHVAACAACRQELAATKRLISAARATPAPELSADGEARLLAAFRAERAAAPDLPQPAAKKRRISRILSMALPLAAAAAVLLVMFVASRTYRVELLHGEGELVASGENAGASVGLDASIAPTFRFAEGDEILAGHAELSIRLALKPRDGASSGSPANGAPAPGAVEMRLLPGARVRRSGFDEVELVAGAVDVAAGPLANPFTILGGRRAAHAVVKGTRFVATTADDRLVVVVREGAVELGRPGGESETLHAGEQGLVDGTRLLRRAVDGRATDGKTVGDVFLTPRVSIERGAGPLEFDASLSVGDGGPVSIVAFDDAYPTFVVRVHAEGDGHTNGGDREIKLQRSMLTGDPPIAGAGGAWRLAANSPYRLRLSLAGIGLPPGRYDASIRYMSYRRHGDGAEWLGVAESARVDFEVPVK